MAASSGGEDDSMVCLICSEVFIKPKFLPCFHTFCASCIQDWANKHGSRSRSSFPCPACRKETSLPGGDADKLQTNYYFSEKTLENGRAGKLCRAHRNQELELFCVGCQETICLTCKLLHHDLHNIMYLKKAVRQKKKNLKAKGERVQFAMDTWKEVQEKALSAQRRNQEQLSHAKQVVNNVLSTAMKPVDFLQRRIEAGLESCHDSLEIDLNKDLRLMNSNKQKLEDTHHELIEAIGTEDIKVMSEAEGVQCFESHDKRQKSCLIDNYPSLYRSLFNTRVFYASVAVLVLGLLFSLLYIYIPFSVFIKDVGTSYSHYVPFLVEERFNCAEEKDTSVRSMCVSSESVMVSYAQRGLRTDVASQRFTKTGEVMESYDNHVGKTFWVRFDDSCVPSQFDSAIAFSKSETLFVLYETQSEKAVIKKIDTHLKQFGFLSMLRNSAPTLKINSQAYRSFDVDSTERFFVVVEEGQFPSLQRTVKVFKKTSPDPFEVYVPQNMTFQPADVCFYKINDADFLLVADEWNNVIHMAVVNDAGVEFINVMESGCPVSTAPTVLHVDNKGDLWVACKGGSIVTLSYRRCLLYARFLTFLIILSEIVLLLCFSRRRYVL